MVPIKIKLPEEFFEEEVRCGFTVTKQMKEVWAIELDLASQLMEICKKHDIQVFADGGTLLGAARHEGFIPWDDDMDFCMLRSDYEKFCKIAPDEFKEPYFFQTAFTDLEYFRGHAQIRNSNTTAILKEEYGKEKFNQGIFIDVFPLDEVVDDQKKFAIQKKRTEFVRRVYWIINEYAYKNKNKDFFKTLTAILINKIYSRDKWYVKYENLLMKYNTGLNRSLSILCLHMKNDKWLRKRESFLQVSYLPFECLHFPVPLEYDDVLSDLYGDWNQYVRGSSAHGIVYFDTNNSYKRYLKGELKFAEKKS